MAARLAADFWAQSETALSRETYGSWRWLSGDSRAERNTLGHIGFESAGPLIVERLPQRGAARYKQLGLVMRDDRPDPDDFGLLAQSLAALNLADGVVEAVSSLVLCVHLLRSTGVGYDVSHSDPQLPFSIFVSLPSGEDHAVLRLAESILHETMHLQLSLIEHRASIVSGTAGSGYSPWQQTERPIAGLVHGLYVFRAIDQWLAAIAGQESESASLQYISHRRLTIADEIATAAHVAQSSALTPFGATLVNALLEI